MKYIANGAVVIGDVTIKNDVNIWYNATVRGDSEKIIIGHSSNVQDNAVIHVDKDYPTIIGDNVTIGHGAIVHGCTVGDNSLIGMGAIVLNGAKIGKNCIIGAGALVTQNMIIPDNSMAFGNPAKIRRSVTEDEIKANFKNSTKYVEEAKLQLEAKKNV